MEDYRLGEETADENFGYKTRLNSKKMDKNHN
jgi:hypothetical protein